MASDVTLCISSEVLPEIKEYERTSTTVINAYVRPIVERYLSTLTAEFARIGVEAPLLLLQSNCGLTPAQAAAVTPLFLHDSGPAAIGGPDLPPRFLTTTETSARSSSI